MLLLAESLGCGAKLEEIGHQVGLKLYLVLPRSSELFPFPDQLQCEDQFPVPPQASRPYLPHSDCPKSLWNCDPKSALPHLSGFSRVLCHSDGKSNYHKDKSHRVFRLTMCWYPRLEIGFDRLRREREKEVNPQPCLSWRVMNWDPNRLHLQGEQETRVPEPSQIELRLRKLGH